MAKLTTVSEAHGLMKHAPNNPDYQALFLSALTVSEERYELEYLSIRLRDAFDAFRAQADRLAAAEARQRIMEINTGLGR